MATTPSSPRKVSAERIALLQAGRAETRNLAEQLAFDMAALLGQVLPEVASLARERIPRTLGVVDRMKAGGSLVLPHLDRRGEAYFVRHPSDTVRGFAAYALMAIPDEPLDVRVARIAPLADDSHFGVREWAWMALRPHLAQALSAAGSVRERERVLALLTPWVLSPRVNLRRFAVEVARPRGVWCNHLRSLIEDPQPGLALLEPLRAEPEKYAQDSVANWLNDAAKSQADWVLAVTERWLRESPVPSTQRIVARARRSLVSAPPPKKAPARSDHGTVSEISSARAQASAKGSLGAPQAPAVPAGRQRRGKTA